MTATKTVNGVQYWLRPTAPAHSCEGCAAEQDDTLCAVLGNHCHGGIWCNTERPETVPQPAPAKGRTTTTQELQVFIRNYQQLAQAIQQVGGSVEILETYTVPQLLETLARNGITLQATYGN